MSREISNTDDIIDSRDVIERLEELETEREELADAVEQDANESTIGELADWDEENGDELKTLKAFAEEGEGFSDWRHGECFVRDSYFKEYAQQLAEDIGAIPNDAQWPCTCIDWDQAARELQMDYSSAEFCGITYYARS